MGEAKPISYITNILIPTISLIIVLVPTKNDILSSNVNGEKIKKKKSILLNFVEVFSANKRVGFNCFENKVQFFHFLLLVCGCDLKTKKKKEGKKEK